MARNRCVRRRNVFLDMEGTVKDWRRGYGSAAGCTQSYLELVVKKKIDKRKIVFFEDCDYARKRLEYFERQLMADNQW